jgi:hypothetical protein
MKSAQATAEERREARKQQARERRDLANFKLVEGFKTAVPEICRYARTGDLNALLAAWFGATQLADTILKIARTQPERLQQLARRSLYMPALVSRSAKVNQSVVKQAMQLDLAADLAGGRGPLLRLDSQVTNLVANWFESVEQRRQQVHFFAGEFRRARAGNKLVQGSEPLADIRLAAIKVGKGEFLCEVETGKKVRPKKYRNLEHYLLEECAIDEDDLPLLDLAPLTTTTVDDWLSLLLKPYAEDDDGKEDDKALERNLDVSFWKSLCEASGKTMQATRRGHGKTVFDIFKQRCKSALRTLADSPKTT